MASETLGVPEEHLADFCRLLRAGLAANHDPPIAPACLEAVEEWVDQTEDYLLDEAGEEEEDE